MDNPYLTNSLVSVHEIDDIVKVDILLALKDEDS